MILQGSICTCYRGGKPGPVDFLCLWVERRTSRPPREGDRFVTEKPIAGTSGAESDSLGETRRIHLIASPAATIFPATPENESPPDMHRAIVAHPDE